MWEKIETEKQIKTFMDKMECFHDSCIKEIKYVSGAFVETDLSMYPVNDQRVLNVLIQRQSQVMPMIELKFSGVKYLKMCPVDVNYTCEILEAALFLNDGNMIWCDNNAIGNNIEDFEGTVICAESMQWRIVKDVMGNISFYMSKS